MKDNRERFRPAVGEVPVAPGVYHFNDRHGRTLYIGKAKNLRARLNNYFQPLHALQPRTRLMLSLADSLAWTVVENDTEALVLEHTWINEYSPPYNVQFRDDKSYPYLAVTLAEEAPRLIITRNERVRGAKYFGPYPKVWAVREMAKLLQQAFPIRTCKDSDYRRAVRSGKPCLAGQIGSCYGPCSGKIDLAGHALRVRELVAFLQGGGEETEEALLLQMRAASEAQDYERAAVFRDQAAAARHVLEHNAVVLDLNTDLDVFGFAEDELHAAAHQFIVRRGRIRGERSWVVEADTEQDLVERVVQSAYGSGGEVPPVVLVPHLPAQVSTLECALSRLRGSRRVRLRVPVRGKRVRLLRRASANAVEGLSRHKLLRAADVQARTDALAQLQRALLLPEPPLRIECIDVSHLAGTQVTASLVVFEDGLPAKGAYRKYRIEKTTDDTDSIYQVVSRRLAQLRAVTVQGDAGMGDTGRVSPAGMLGRYRERPQLLLVDGGEPQVRAAFRALEESGVTGVTVCGIAKRLEELWPSQADFPVILPRSSEALFLVQRVRDEAHRVAITFQRARRSTSLASSLAEVPGLGPKRVQALLRHFGSVARLKRASLQELEGAPGMGPFLARSVYEALAQLLALSGRSDDE